MELTYLKLDDNFVIQSFNVDTLLENLPAYIKKELRDIEHFNYSFCYLELTNISKELQKFKDENPGYESDKENSITFLFDLKIPMRVLPYIEEHLKKAKENVKELLEKHISAVGEIKTLEVTHSPT